MLKEYANTVIIASPSEFENAVQLMQSAHLKERIMGRIAPEIDNCQAIATLQSIRSLYSVPFKEVIFCEGTLSFKRIIESIKYIPKGVWLKFHAINSDSIVGSDSKNTSGEAVSIEPVFNLAIPYNKRIKRLIDIIISTVALITFPIHFIGVKRPISFISNCFAVLVSKKTWVGYMMRENNLPNLRTAVIGSSGIPVKTKQELPKETIQKLDEWYAKDYEPFSDLKLIVRSYRLLGH